MMDSSQPQTPTLESQLDATLRLLQELQVRADVERGEAAAKLEAVRSAAAAEIAAVRDEAAVAAQRAAEMLAAAAAAAAAELAAAHKSTFFMKLDSIAASASEKSDSDVSRRRAPKPNEVRAEVLIARFPDVSGGDVAAAWRAYCLAHKSFFNAGERFQEVPHVQPVISARRDSWKCHSGWQRLLESLRLAT